MFDTGTIKTMYFREKNEYVLYENQQLYNAEESFDQREKKEVDTKAYYDFGF